jgi:hypothetical protein
MRSERIKAEQNQHIISTYETTNTVFFFWCPPLPLMNSPDTNEVRIQSDYDADSIKQAHTVMSE